MKKYLLYSTLIGIFSEALRIQAGIDLKLIYLIFFINYIILISIKQIFVPKFLIYVILYLLASTVIGCIMKTDKFMSGFQQILGIVISALYFYNFFIYLDHPIEDIFEKYVKVTTWLSIIGILLFTINILGNADYRLQSLMTEPAHFCGVVSPAFYYLLKNFKQNKFSFFCVTLSLILSGSSVGYLCMLLSFFLYSKKIFVPQNIIVYSSICLLGVAAYFAIDNVRLRVDDTFNSSLSSDVSGANWSTYALISNLFVTENVLIKSPVLGNGLGSHELSHAKYIGDLTGKESFEEMQDLNAADANSLGLRVLSDMGFLGALLIVIFISKYYVKEEPLYVLPRALIIYFFYKLFREGHYFPPEMYFFVFMYLLYYRQFKTNREAGLISNVELAV